MKLSRDICLGGRYNNKNITGIKLNGYIIYDSEDTPSGFTFVFVTDTADDMPITFKQGVVPCELNITTTQRSDGLYTREVEFVDESNKDIKITKNYSTDNPNESIKRIEQLSGDYGNFVYIFSGLRELEYADLSAWNTSKVTSMNYMFKDCKFLTTLDISNFDTSNVTSMTGMFNSCAALKRLNLSSFNTANVTDMQFMFHDCQSLKEVTVGSFNTTNVTNMTGMFYQCYELVLLRLKNFDTTNVTNMMAMFRNCESLGELDLSRFNTANVTNMAYMFMNCQSLFLLDLSNFDTTNVTDMSMMFYGCTALTELILDNCNNATINKIIAELPTFSSGTHTIYCKQANAEGLTAPKGWTFSYV